MTKKMLLAIASLMIATGPAWAGEGTDCAGPTTGDTIWIAQFGDGNAGDFTFVSQINFINLSSTASDVEVRTFDSEGNPRDLLRQVLSPSVPFESVDMIQETIPGGGTGMVFSLTGDPDGALRTGYASVTTQQEVGLEVQFNISGQDQNPLLSSTLVRASSLTTEASFLANVGPGVRTGLALLNPPSNTLATNVELRLFDSNGDAVTEGMITLEPGRRISRFLDEFFQNLGEFNGSVEIRTNNDCPIVVLPLRQQGIVLTTQDLFPPRDDDS